MLIHLPEVVGGDERAGMHSNASNELIFKIGAASERMTIDADGIDVTGKIKMFDTGGTQLRIGYNSTYFWGHRQRSGKW